MAGKQVFVAAIAAMALTGCASAVTLASRDGGPSGQGVSTGAMGNHGQLKITLEGKPYVGEWIVSAEGRFTGYSNAAVRPASFAGQKIAYASNVVRTGASGDSEGHAYAKAADGAALHCRFNVNAATATAFGLCERDDGRLYDLTMRQ